MADPWDDPAPAEAAPATAPTPVSPKLTPVDGNPFEDAGPKLTPVEGNPFKDPWDEPEDWQPVNNKTDPMPDALQTSVPEAFLDRVRAGQALTRITQAAMKGASEVLGDFTPTGFENETLNHLIDLGVFHDPAKGPPGPIQFLNEAVMIPSARVWQAVNTGLNAGIHGAGGALGQIVQEFGGSQGQGEEAKNEVISLANWAMIEGGMGGFSRSTVTPQGGVIDQTIGGLPKPQDFANAASRLYVGRDPAPVEANLKRMWSEDGIHPAEAFHDAQNDAFLKNEITAKNEVIKPDPETEKVLTETGGVPGSLSAAVTPPEDVPLKEQPAPPVGTWSAAAKVAADKLFDVGRDIQMKLTPMATGSVDSMATVKDYMNAMRRNAWDSSRIDTDLMDNFTADQRERMAHAMEEESLSLRLGEPDTAREHQGLATLEPDERQAVVALDSAQQLAWLRARDAGVVEGDGIPMHFPRMAIGAKGDTEIGKPPSLTQMYGIRKNSPYTKQRQYMEAEETEAALKAKYGDQAKIAWDIRAVNLATKTLDDATAGRTLINNIQEVGRRTGSETIAEGFKPDDTWFTVDHPAFQKWRPRLGEDAEGNFGSIKDGNGNPQFEQVPIYVRGDFEGPIRAALWGKSGANYQGMMALKGKTMSLIMNSPMIHNLVEFGRAFPAMPLRIFKAYFDGYRAKQDVGLMHEAIDAGLVPIGKRFFNQDINTIMEAPDLTPGRSWTAKLLSAVPGLFDEAAGTAVKQAIDKAGDFWHNTLLWDRVADLQMGLYTNFRGDLINKGFDQMTASRIAAHFANRYAGALPKEAMSEMATKVSNFLLFSRSFTVGNWGVMKDMVTGLPRDVLAQIERDAGFRAGSIDEAGKPNSPVDKAASSARAIARRKAISTVALDMGLMMAGNSILQSAFNVILGSNLSQEEHEYLRRARDVINDVAVHPLSLLNPFYIAGIPGRLSSTYNNEPGRQNRVMIGTAKDGTAIYARNPIGKIGEEFSGYFDSPLDMVRKKEGTILRPLMQIYDNDAGFGRKVYDPNAETLMQRAGVIWAIAKHIMESQLPMGQIGAFSDLVKGEGDKTVNLLQAFGPLAGVTFSKGAPGGPAVGEMYAARTQHDFQVSQAMPDIRRQIQRGDLRGAQQRMTELGIPTGLQRFYVRTTLNPATRMSPRAVKDFYLYSSPEQRARFDRARSQ